MKILALEPYYGGSHQAFLDGWRSRSRHDFTCLTLPPYKWKWRMRHSAVTFADEAAQAMAEGQSWDMIWCSDMLNLASFLGLAPAALRHLLVIIYFHENQLTYPVRYKDDRDFHFSFTNLTSALAADQVWFNSRYHQDSYLEALAGYCRKMPDYQPTAAIGQIRDKALIMSPGIQEIPHKPRSGQGPLHILWAARWEYDKDPETFFQAVDLLAERQVEFRLSVAGEHFKRYPKIFDEARERHAERIVHWGYQPDRQAYEAVLQEADVMVSTARHEFFGIGVLEAALAGAFPLVPRDLAYPETMRYNEGHEDFFYEGGPEELAHRLGELATQKTADTLWQGSDKRARRCAERYLWQHRVPIMDEAIERLLEG